MNDCFTQLGDWSNEGAQAAGVILQDHKGRTLLQLRDINDHTIGAGHWSFFGGHLEKGEDLRTTAVREFREETGITLNAAEITPLAKALSANGTRLYAYTSNQRVEPAQVRLGEGAGFAFLTPAQIRNLPLMPAAGAILYYYLENRPS